jgi:hypothetical protein
LLSEEDLQEHFSEIITDVIWDQQALRLRVHTPTHAPQIVTLAAQIDYDLFILFLNNIVFPKDNLPLDKRTNQGLKFVAQLKTRYPKAITGLYG